MMSILRWCVPSSPPKAITLLRVLVGSVFLGEGLQKLLFPGTLGARWFEKIGIPTPHIMGPFVAFVEVVLGPAVLRGLLTHLTVILLLVVILVTMATTKAVVLPKARFLAVAHIESTLSVIPTRGK